MILNEAKNSDLDIYLNIHYLMDKTSPHVLKTRILLMSRIRELIDNGKDKLKQEITKFILDIINSNQVKVITPKIVVYDENLHLIINLSYNLLKCITLYGYGNITHIIYR